ncbi:Ig-like domain-containing protein [Mucilaginibacter glaciei]|uniref:Ig-like domain-containing protein n=1 Tax=Mucilaginibacter glaciei TaxID=2772109 RepID=A0A926S271_9SPHI|nr:Ig-like domain-containing protein [Mucilaginibacter glaciei]MBD1393552.1 Ig-like domain-containing protein [Mucilaginibacter glaciei]
MQRPNGGPRDLTPPKLLKATPENMTRNFNAKSIRLEFDEYYKLQNPYQEISISPAMEKQPEYKTDKKNLVINFKDSLLKNTTYVINFGKAIADVNESNVLKNFTYVFSTGTHIDSLSISGSVINSITQAKEKDATVMLFPLKQDSLLFGKKKPAIFATTDSAGNFSLNNLREDTYRIYALKEASADKIYNDDQELIGFLKTPIKVDKDTSAVQLKLFKQTAEKFRLLSQKRFDPDGKITFVFNKPVQKPSLKIIYPAAFDNQKIVQISNTKDTALLFMRNMDFDSLRVALYDNNKPLDSASFIKGRKEAFTHNITFKYNINRDNKLRPGSDLIVTANFPLDSYNTSLISLKEDSVELNNLTFEKDTTNANAFIIRNRYRAKSKYELVLNEGAVTDIYGGKNKRQGIRFEGDKTENYSILTLKVTVPDATKQYVVEILNEQKNVMRSDVITKSTSLVYKNYLTGKYNLRVIYDDNKNGRWDSGNVRLKTYPENIYPGDKEITLRPNWDAEETLDIPKEVVTP